MGILGRHVLQAEMAVWCAGIPGREEGVAASPWAGASCQEQSPSGPALQICARQVLERCGCSYSSVRLHYK